MISRERRIRLSAALTDLPSVAIEDIEVFADDPDVERAAAIYKEYGCLVVRGLMERYVPQLASDIEAVGEGAAGDREGRRFDLLRLPDDSRLEGEPLGAPAAGRTPIDRP